MRSYCVFCDIVAGREPANVLYEDDDAIAVFKPSGLLTHPTEAKEKDTLLSRVSAYTKLREKGRGRALKYVWTHSDAAVHSGVPHSAGSSTVQEGETQRPPTHGTLLQQSLAAAQT